MRRTAYTLTEAAKATGHATSTLSRWIAAGIVPATKLGRFRLLTVETVEAIKTGRPMPRAEPAA